jgi:Mn-dependent DtxR family transcriptional regulator
LSYSLTDRQREFLDFIREYIKKNESSPAIEDLARHFHLNPPTAHKMLEDLRAKGRFYFLTAIKFPVSPSV